MQQKKENDLTRTLFNIIENKELDTNIKDEQISLLIRNSQGFVQGKMSDLAVDINATRKYTVPEFNISEGNLKKVDYILKADSVEMTVVTAAIFYKNSLKTIKLLLEYDAEYRNLESAKQDKVIEGNSQAIKRDKMLHKKFILALVYAQGRRDILEYLFQEKKITDVNIHYHYRALIPFFYKNTHNPDVGFTQCSSGVIGISPLELAVRNGHSDVVQFSLEKEANVELKSVLDYGDAKVPGQEPHFLVDWHCIQESSLLSIAAYKNDTNMVKVLLASGKIFEFSRDKNFDSYRAEVEKRIPELKGIKVSVIDMAIRNNNLEMLKLLLLQLSCFPACCLLGSQSTLGIDLIESILKKLKNLYTKASYENCENLLRAFLAFEKAKLAYEKKNRVQVIRFIAEAYDRSPEFILEALDKDAEFLLQESQKERLPKLEGIRQEKGQQEGEQKEEEQEESAEEQVLYLKMFIKEIHRISTPDEPEFPKDEKKLTFLQENILGHLMAYDAAQPQNVFWKNNEEKINWIKQFSKDAKFEDSLNNMSGDNKSLAQYTNEGTSGTPEEKKEISEEPVETKKTVLKVAGTMTLGLTKNTKRKESVNNDEQKEQKTIIEETEFKQTS